MIARLATIAALVAAVILVGVLIFGGDGGHRYTMLFATGGQLVKGNEVQIGGAPVGTIDDITLTEDNQAQVDVTIDEVLHEGTTAVIRTPSLSTVAGRYISVSPGPDNAPEIAEDEPIAGDATTTPVDLDQLFNTFDKRTREGLQEVIQGFAGIYAGKGEEANETYKYFSPALSSTGRLLKKLGEDQQVFTDFVVDTSKVVTAIAERRDDLTDLVSNANVALGAIADETAAFDRDLQLLPPTLRQANTTFVNLRAALDDIDPLVNTAKPATKDLALFLRRLRPVVRRAVPVFTDLRLTVTRPGPDNDLGELVRNLVPLAKLGGPASRSGVRALNASQETITFARPYAPEVIASFGKLGAVSGYYDGDGNYARVQAAAFNLFRYNQLTDLLEPIPAAEKFSGFELLPASTRCPGGATQPITGSNPFLDQGRLNGKCDPADVPPGP